VNSDVPLLSQCRLVSRPLSEAVASSSPLQPRLSPLQRIECYRQKFRPSVRALLTPMDLGITPWPLADTQGWPQPHVHEGDPSGRPARPRASESSNERPLEKQIPEVGRYIKQRAGSAELAKCLRTRPMPPLDVAGRH
jgi:hypothetical protein